MSEQQKRTRAVNDIGLGMAAIGNERMRGFILYEESGSVIVRCDCHTDGIDEITQYLTPEEAMAFSKAFERCAIAALKNRA